jgi:hypothetical protein
MQSTPSSEYLYLVSETISELQNMHYSIWEEFVLYVFPVTMIIDSNTQKFCTCCFLYEFICIFDNQWRMQWIYRCKFYNIYFFNI